MPEKFILANISLFKVKFFNVSMVPLNENITIGCPMSYVSNLLAMRQLYSYYGLIRE